MRVVAGDLGGRKLLSPRGSGVRPTSDRVREALFSILGDVGGLTVLDLFAGTGALSIEAISRGAARAVLVDRDPAPAAANVEALGVGERCEVVGSEVVRFVDRAEGSFDLVLADPPYDLPDRLARRLTSALEHRLPQLLAPGARVVVESAADRQFELALPPIDERLYGGTMIRIHGGV